MKTTAALLLTAALAAPALAQGDAAPPKPFAVFRGANGALYINVPVPAYAASQVQAAAEQRARDVEAGAAGAWGTAQADWLIAQLRASGVLPPAAPPSAPEAAASPAEAAEAAASAPQEEADAALPPLAPGMDEDTLRHLIALFYGSDSERAMHEKTYAFRRDTRRAMKDVLIIAASLYSLGQGSGVDWAQLEDKAQNLVDTHGPQITAIFLEGIKAAARARQTAASEPPAASEPASESASTPASAPASAPHIPSPPR